MRSDSIYLFDPYRPGSGLELLAGSGELRGTDTASFVDGPGTTARFNEPTALVVIDSEQCLYIADCGHNRIRRMTLPPHLFTIE